MTGGFASRQFGGLRPLAVPAGAAEDDLLYIDAAGNVAVLPLGAAGEFVGNLAGHIGYDTPAGGGGGGSQIAITAEGLSYFEDFPYPDQTLTASAGPGGLLVATTIDQGAWLIRQHRLVNTSHGNYDRCRTLTPNLQYGVFECGMLNPVAASMYVGMRLQVQSGANSDLHTLNKSPSDEQFNARVAGSDTSISVAARAFATNELLIDKIYSTTPTGANKWKGTRWLNGVVVLGSPTSESSAGPFAAGGIGFVCYNNGQTLDAEFVYYAAYTSTTITVAGLTGTQAWRLMSKSGQQISASAAQSSGTATIDTALLPSGLIEGWIEIHTSTAFSSQLTGGRFPAEGQGIIIAGRTYTYTP